jgi:hypothetical protein
MTRLVRVFPRRTKATSNDSLAYFGPPCFGSADEVEVDCTFTWDNLAALCGAATACRRLPGAPASPALPCADRAILPEL